MSGTVLGVPGSGFRVPGSGFRVPGAGCRVPGAAHRMPREVHRVLSDGSDLPSAICGLGWALSAAVLGPSRSAHRAGFHALSARVPCAPLGQALLRSTRKVDIVRSRPARGCAACDGCTRGQDGTGSGEAACAEERSGSVSRETSFRAYSGPGHPGWSGLRAVLVTSDARMGAAHSPGWPAGRPAPDPDPPRRLDDLGG